MWIMWMGSLSTEPPRSGQGEGDKIERIKGELGFINLGPKLIADIWKHGNITKRSDASRNISVDVNQTVLKQENTELS